MGVSRADRICHFHFSCSMADRAVWAAGDASAAAKRDDHVVRALCAQGQSRLDRILLPAHDLRFLFVEVQGRMQRHQQAQLFLNARQPRARRKHQPQSAVYGKLDQARILRFFQIDAAQIQPAIRSGVEL